MFTLSMTDLFCERLQKKGVLASVQNGLLRSLTHFQLVTRV